MKTDKILLISANQHTVPYPVFPLGAMYLATHLRNTFPQKQVELFDCNLGDLNQLTEAIAQFKPDVVGVSLRNVDGCNSFDKSSFINGYQRIIKTVRSATSAKLIIGGAGYSIYPELLFETFAPDFGIYGEGEDALTQLLIALENNSEYQHIEGLVYRTNNHTSFNPKSCYLRSIDVQFDPALADYYWKHSGMLNIQTKRGCPYNCIYCSYPVIEGRTVRTLNADHIVDNIKKLYQTKNINYLFFTDSVFNICNEFNHELCEKIIASGIKIRWGAYFSPNLLTEEMLTLYKKAGLTHIEFGTESLSDTQLENYGKHFTVADVIEKSTLCNKVGVYFAHFLILGGYGETDATIDETFENSKKIDYSVFFPYVGMRIYPKTKLREYAIRDGIISADNPLLEPAYYISDQFDQSLLKHKASTTGKTWIFPDDPADALMEQLRIKKNKKGPLWEYLRK